MTLRLSFLLVALEVFASFVGILRHRFGPSQLLELSDDELVPRITQKLSFEFFHRLEEHGVKTGQYAFVERGKQMMQGVVTEMAQRQEMDSNTKIHVKCWKNIVQRHSTHNKFIDKQVQKLKNITIIKIVCDPTSSSRLSYPFSVGIVQLDRNRSF